MQTEKGPGWAETVGAVALVLLLGSLALIAAGGWTWFARFLESAAPAWVQAIGSIAAIVAAIVVANRQYEQTVKRELRADARNQTQVLGVALALAERAEHALREGRGYVTRPFTREDAWETSDEMIRGAQLFVDRFGALPFHTLPSYEDVSTAYELLDDLRVALDELAVLGSYRDSTLSVSPEVLRELDIALESVDDNAKLLESSWRSALGGSKDAEH